MPKRKLLESINELWNNQYTYFILIGFIVGICTGFSNVIFHFFYNSITDLFLNPLAKKKFSNFWDFDWWSDSFFHDLHYKK